MTSTMKWHDDNPEKFREHCVLCAVDQEFAIREEFDPDLKAAEAAGLIRKVEMFVLTEAGDKRLAEVAEEIRIACESEPL